MNEVLGFWRCAGSIYSSEWSLINYALWQKIKRDTLDLLYSPTTSKVFDGLHISILIAGIRIS